jgi:UDP-glucose 4-epimerase
MDKKVLITGVAGLLGSRLADWIIENQPDYQVIGIDDLSGGYKENVNPKVKFIELNLVTESYRFDVLMKEYKPDYVFHFAAYAAEGLSPFIRKFNYTNNVISSVNLINHCIQRDIKIVFTSSMAVYGNQIPPFNENMVPSPIDPYGLAKFSIEKDIISANNQFGLKYNIIRPHNVLGIYQNIWDRDIAKEEYVFTKFSTVTDFKFEDIQVFFSQNFSASQYAFRYYFNIKFDKL